MYIGTQTDYMYAHQEESNFQALRTKFLNKYIVEKAIII